MSELPVSARRAGLVLAALVALPGCLLTSTLDAELHMPEARPQSVTILALEGRGASRHLRVESRTVFAEGERTKVFAFSVPAGVAVLDSRVVPPIEESCVHAVGFAHKTRVTGDYSIEVYDGHERRVIGVVPLEADEPSVLSQVAFWGLFPFSMAADLALSPIEFVFVLTPAVTVFDRD